ncbi:hypothetical protein VBD025_12510 [Virgibacillus flavescens]|uniref:hypothetical protein n=1 Tax=Virgibacillus flavescens TaxID=1611422 RepID=UPI003D33098E
MSNKEQYFVTIDNEEIREISLPDSGIEYEIYANSEEIKDLELLFIEKKKNGQQAADFLKKPFDEWGADDERNKYEKDLVIIYQKIYDLGTPETKKKIDELGFLS